MKTERRAVARYKAKLVVQINMDEYSFSATSMEISLEGLRIVCEGSENSIFNRYIQVTPGENIVANIEIKIPKSKGLLAETLICQTRVISVSRISQNSYIVGFNIVEFNGEGQAVWQDYISKKH